MNFGCLCLVRVNDVWLYFCTDRITDPMSRFPFHSKCPLWNTVQYLFMNSSLPSKSNIMGLKTYQLLYCFVVGILDDITLVRARLGLTRNGTRQFECCHAYFITHNVWFSQQMVRLKSPSGIDFEHSFYHFCCSVVKCVVRTILSSLDSLVKILLANSSKGKSASQHNVK